MSSLVERCHDTTGFDAAFSAPSPAAKRCAALVDARIGDALARVLAVHASEAEIADGLTANTRPV